VIRVERIGDATPWVRIYALCDYPEVPRYVGKTVRWLGDRHKAHIRAAQTIEMPRLPVHRWIRKQISINAPLVIKLLENVEDASIWAERERFWIAKLRSDGANLLNLTNGGEGLHGHVFTVEHRANIAAGLRTGSTFSCETCGVAFWRKPRDIKKGDNRFCSRSCYALSLKDVSRPVPALCTERGVAAAAAARRAQTDCKRGHPLSGDNLFLTSGGGRGCKECRRLHKQTYRKKVASNG
jgi:hypothetical protein